MKSESIQIYEDVLRGTLKRFPRGFWVDDESKNFQASAEITRYLIEEILHWDDKTLKREISCQVFFKHKLRGMLYMLFNDSVYAAINNAYPNKYYEWEFKCTPRNFWTLENAKRATIWLFKEKLNWSDDDIRHNVSRKIFVENGLDTMMHVLFKNNAKEALSNAFPDLFR